MKVHCTRISVDCVENDPVDICIGGPEYLGFDFNVRKKDYEYMKEFVIETILGYDIPIIGIYNTGDIDVEKDKVWTEQRIAAEVRKERNYLLSEYEHRRNHK